MHELRFCLHPESRSPRIVPGAASTGFVAPFIALITRIASFPTTTIETRGAGGDEFNKGGKERPGCMFTVVFFCSGFTDNVHPEGDNFETSPFYSGNNLSNKPALDSVRFYHNVCLFHMDTLTIPNLAILFVYTFFNWILPFSVHSVRRGSLPRLKLLMHLEEHIK